MTRYGLLLLLSGASGTGKTTVRNHLMETVDNLRFSVSCTTRAPRAGERPGTDYHFVSSDEFRRRIRNNEFLEHASVHGNRYGTLRAEVESCVESGGDVLLDIDVQGGRQVVRNLRGSWLAPLLATVFIAPPDEQTLEDRLRQRGTEDPDALRLRLANAKSELTAWNEYRYVVVNRDVDAAVAELVAILKAERCRTALLRTPPFAAG